MDCSQNRHGYIRWRCRWSHNASTVDYRTNKKFTIHEILKYLRTTVILRVVRGGRESRLRQAFRNARMPA